MPQNEAWDPIVAPPDGPPGSTAPDGDDQPSVAAAADAGSWLQAMAEAAAVADKVNTPEAWRAAATAAEALSQMAQRQAVVAEAEQRAQELVQAAEAANRTAQDRARAAAEAVQRAQELAQAAEAANRTAQDHARAAAEAGGRRPQVEPSAAEGSEPDSGAARGEAHQGVVTTRDLTVDSAGGRDRHAGSLTDGPAATQLFAEGPRRRRLPREPESQLAKFRIEGDEQQRWRPCRLTDISVAGAGLELLETTPAASKGRTIALLVEDKAGVRLIRGEIRQVRTTADGTVRVGLRFVELAETSRKQVESMQELNIRW